MSSSSEAEFEDGEEMEEGEYREEPAPKQEEDPPPRRAKRQISYKEDDDLDGKGDYDVDQDEEDDDDDEDEEDDDSDDDIPLSQLAGKKSKAKPAAKKNGTKKKASPAKKKAKTKAAAPAKKANNGNKSYDHASEALYGSKCDKGLLIQRLLCRWWYAIEWPENVQKEPPEHYDSLDGFPGVFVCTSTSGDQDVGHILDTRDEETRPCFQNFSKKSSSELKELLIQALDGQEKVLGEAKQNGTASADADDVLKELKGMRKWANKVNANKADKEASKLLKGFKVKK